MRPEQQRFFLAYLRAVPWALAAGMAGLGLWFLLRPPAWCVIPMLLVPPLVVLWLRVREEWRVMTAPAREARAARIARGEPPPPRPTPLQWVVAVAYALLPVAGCALLVLGDGAVRYVGLGLIGLFVFERGVLLPWRAIRHHRRERASRAR